MKHARADMITLFVFIVLLTSLFTSFLVFSQNLWDYQDSFFVGEPVNNTVFASYANDNGSSVIFPQAFERVTNRPLVYETDYSEFVPLIMIEYEEALEIAEGWLERIGPSMIIWNLLSHTNTTSPPSWTFYFTHVDFYAFVTVDAIKGLVIEYESKYLHDYDPTVLTLEESEQLVQDFLTSESIPIPSTARYIKGEPYDCQRFFSLVFQEYVGPVKVEDSQVLIRASAFTRGISYFKYSWVGIDEVDISGVLSPEVARKNSFLQLSEVAGISDPEWMESELALSEIAPTDSSIDRSWRLAWVLHLVDGSNSEYDAEIFVDAFSGNVFGFRSTNSSYSDILEHSTLYSTETLLSIGTGSLITLGIVVVYTLYRWKEHA